MPTRSDFEQRIRPYWTEVMVRLERTRVGSARLGSNAARWLREQAAALRGIGRRARPGIDALAKAGGDALAGVRRGSVRAYRAASEAIRTASEATRRSVGPIWANRSRYLQQARRELEKQGARLRRAGASLAPKVDALGRAARHSAGRLRRAGERSWESAVKLARRAVQSVRRDAAGDRPREATQQASLGASTAPRPPETSKPTAGAKRTAAPAAKKTAKKPPRKRSVRTASGTAAKVEMKSGKKKPAAKRATARKKTGPKAKPADKAASRPKPAKKAAG